MRVRSPPTHFIFLTMLQKEECHSHFSGGKYKVLDFPLWMQESPNNDAKELFVVVDNKTSGRKQPVIVFGFRFTDDAVLREVTT